MEKKTVNKFRVIIAFLLGVASSGTIYASGLSFNSGDVEHAKSNGTTTTVKAALNELISIHNDGTATAGDIVSGKNAYVGGYLISGTMPKPTAATGNTYTGTAGYLNNGSSALTSSTSLTLSSYLSSNQYNFKIGGGEQITFPGGYYQYPINISSAKSSISSSNFVLVAGTKGDSSVVPTGVSTYTVTEAGTYLICAADGGGSNSSSLSIDLWVKLNGTEIAGSDTSGKPGYTGSWLWFNRVGRTTIQSRDYMMAKAGIIIRNLAVGDVLTFSGTSGTGWVFKLK